MRAIQVEWQWQWQWTATADGIFFKIARNESNANFGHGSRCLGPHSNAMLPTTLEYALFAIKVKKYKWTILLLFGYTDPQFSGRCHATRTQGTKQCVLPNNARQCIHRTAASGLAVPPPVNMEARPDPNPGAFFNAWPNADKEHWRGAEGKQF